MISTSYPIPNHLRRKGVPTILGLKSFKSSIRICLDSCSRLQFFTWTAILLRLTKRSRLTDRRTRCREWFYKCVASVLLRTWRTRLSFVLRPVSQVRHLGRYFIRHSWRKIAYSNHFGNTLKWQNFKTSLSCPPHSNLHSLIKVSYWLLELKQDEFWNRSGRASSSN